MFLLNSLKKFIPKYIPGTRNYLEFSYEFATTPRVRMSVVEKFGHTLFVYILSGIYPTYIVYGMGLRAIENFDPVLYE